MKLYIFPEKYFCTTTAKTTHSWPSRSFKGFRAKKTPRIHNLLGVTGFLSLASSCKSWLGLASHAGVFRGARFLSLLLFGWAGVCREGWKTSSLNSPAWETWIFDKEIGKKKLCSSNSDLPCDFKLRNLFQCNVKLSARKDSLVVGSPRKRFDFNSLKSPFLGFRVIQTEYWPDFNLESVFYH